MELYSYVILAIILIAAIKFIVISLSDVIDDWTVRSGYVLSWIWGAARVSVDRPENLNLSEDGQKVMVHMEAFLDENNTLILEGAWKELLLFPFRKASRLSRVRHMYKISLEIDDPTRMIVIRLSRLLYRAYFIMLLLRTFLAPLVVFYLSMITRYPATRFTVGSRVLSNAFNAPPPPEVQS